MKKQTIMGVIRHTLTFIGGILVTKSIIDESTMQGLIGSLTTTIGLIWSVAEKAYNHEK
jgi:hypothetical protein